MMASDPHIEFNPEAIPSELKQRDQWLHWDASADKPRRPHANGDFTVAWTDPDDWLSFEEAVAAAENEPSWGIGYVFANGNEDYLRGLYGGLDLDGCVETENGRRRPKDWLPELLPFANETYMEFSPSGEGIHIPLVGFETPEWWANAHFTADEHEGVEAYDSKFFTFTGDQLNASADAVGDVDMDAVHDWLADVYETITGDDPREVHTTSGADTTTRETQKDREDLADVETTTEYDDILDAVDHLRPHDLPLRSSKTGDENSEWESWDPAYRQSRSGESLKRNKDSGMFLDFGEANPKQCTPFGPLDLFAAEEGIIRRPYDDLSGEDWHAAVDRARDQGAPIPAYAGVDGDVPEDQELDTDDSIDEAANDEIVWDAWSQARISGSLDADAVVPTPALRYIVREHLDYDLANVPEDVDGLPWRPHNRALSWLLYEWAPDELGIDPYDEDTDLDAVTARSYKSHDPDNVFSWDAVRWLYDDNKEDGRYAAVRLLRRRHEFLTPEDTEELHIYNEDLGIYEIGANHVVGRRLDRNLGSHYSTHEKTEILSRLRELKYERDELEAQRFDGTYVCVENGVLDVHSREMHDHDPKWLFTRRLPVEYDPDADCPTIRRFLQDITRREADWKTMVEMVGNALLPNYRYESFLVLFGRGANGKSTWLNVVRQFLGRDNVENIMLQKITDRRFAASNLVGKWANIGEDLPQKKIQDLGMLKDLTGGGETWVEPKGKPGFDFQNRAKMMFAANEPPVLGERNHAIARRILPIRLPHRYTADPDDDHKDRIDDLEQSLTTEDELSGLLNLVLDGLERLTDNSDFSLPESPEERLEYYEQFSDHIKMFAVNCLENAPGESEDKDTVYNAYTSFCNEKGREAVSRQVFWDQIRKTTLDVTVSRPQKADGSRHRVVNNLTFTDHGRQFASEYETDDYEVPTISSLATGDAGVTVEGRVTATQSDTPGPIAQKVTIVDETDEITVTIWDDANKPTLAEGQPYRFKNVEVVDYDGHREVQVDKNSGIEELSDGVGNVPPADPGSNQQLDAAADGGEQPAEDTADGDETPHPDAGGGETVNLKPKVVQHVRSKDDEYPDGVPRDIVFAHLVKQGADPDAAGAAIDNALADGRVHEPRSDRLRVT